MLKLIISLSIFFVTTIYNYQISEKKITSPVKIISHNGKRLQLPDSVQIDIHVSWLENIQEIKNPNTLKVDTLIVSVKKRYFKKIKRQLRQLTTNT